MQDETNTSSMDRPGTYSTWFPGHTHTRHEMKIAMAKAMGNAAVLDPRMESVLDDYAHYAAEEIPDPIDSAAEYLRISDGAIYYDFDLLYASLWAQGKELL